MNKSWEQIRLFARATPRRRANISFVGQNFAGFASPWPFSPLAHANDEGPSPPKPPIHTCYYYPRDYEYWRNKGIWLNIDEEQTCRVLPFCRFDFYVISVLVLRESSFEFLLLSDAACCLVLPDFSISRPWLSHIYTMFEANLPFFPFLFSHRGATVDTHATLDDDGAPAISSRPMLQDCWMIDTTCCLKSRMDRLEHYEWRLPPDFSHRVILWRKEGPAISHYTLHV